MSSTRNFVAHSSGGGSLGQVGFEWKDLYLIENIYLSDNSEVQFGSLVLTVDVYGNLTFDNEVILTGNTLIAGDGISISINAGTYTINNLRNNLTDLADVPDPEPATERKFLTYNNLTLSNEWVNTPDGALPGGDTGAIQYKIDGTTFGGVGVVSANNISLTRTTGDNNFIWGGTFFSTGVNQVRSTICGTGTTFGTSFGGVNLYDTLFLGNEDGTFTTVFSGDYYRNAMISSFNSNITNSNNALLFKSIGCGVLGRAQTSLNNNSNSILTSSTCNITNVDLFLGKGDISNNLILNSNLSDIQNRHVSDVLNRNSIINAHNSEISIDASGISLMDCILNTIVGGSNGLIKQSDSCFINGGTGNTVNLCYNSGMFGGTTNSMYDCINSVIIGGTGLSLTSVDNTAYVNRLRINGYDARSGAITGTTQVLIRDPTNPEKVTIATVDEISSGGGGGSSSFLGLTDTPSIYTDNAEMLVRVNAGETALEFYDVSNYGFLTTIDISGESIGSLSDVDITGISEGGTLVWQTDKFVPGTATVGSIGDLSDVDTTGVTFGSGLVYDTDGFYVTPTLYPLILADLAENDLLSWDGENWYNIANNFLTTNSNLEDLFDVVIDPITLDENQSIVFSSVDGWVNRFLSLHDTTDFPEVSVGDASKVLAVNGTEDGFEWVDNTDESVKYDADDSTSGYIVDKIIAGDGILLSEGTGENENKMVITNNDKGSDVDLSSYAQTEDVKKYSGFENRTDSAIGMVVNDFQITTATSYNVYINGIGKITITAPHSIAITDEGVLTYVYFDWHDGAIRINKSTSAWDISDGANIPVAIVFKNGSSYAVTDERHGYNRNLDWHTWAHNTIGARYKSGFSVESINNTSFELSNGIIYDEDIGFNTAEHFIGNLTSATLIYRSTVAGQMNMIRNSARPYAYNSVDNRVQYDLNGTLTDVDNNNFVTNWVFATNDMEEPIYIVVGQNNHNTITLARNDAYPEIRFSTAEWKLIYRVIYKGQTPVYQEIMDYRNDVTPIGQVINVNDHNNLIGRDTTNAHPASAIGFTSSGTLVSTDVNSAIDEVQGNIPAAFTQSDILVKNSIEKVALDENKLQLVGDEASPGNNKYYGTDGTGTKGYHDVGGSGGLTKTEVIKIVWLSE